MDGCDRVTFFKGQQGPLRQMAYQMMTGQFLTDPLKIPSLREADIVIKSRFGDVGLSIHDSIWGPLSYF